MARPEREELKKRLEFSEHKRAQLQSRLSKGSIEEDATLWSFVDLMTLLLILFILFYSHAMAHKGSAKNVFSKQEQSSADQSWPVHKTSIATESIAFDPYQPKPEVNKSKAEKQDESLELLEQQVLQTVSEKLKKDVSIRWNQKRLVLVLGERIAFNVGNADLLPDFKLTLKRIAEFISSQTGYKIVVAGHTDNAPIKTIQFPTNWELSAIRAVNVAKFMILHGVNPHQISIEGYSAYRPIHPNTTADNKQANRRVEITLIKDPENGKSIAEKTPKSALDLFLKSQNAANLSTYPPPNLQPSPKISFLKLVSKIKVRTRFALWAYLFIDEREGNKEFLTFFTGWRRENLICFPYVETPKSNFSSPNIPFHPLPLSHPAMDPMPLILFLVFCRILMIRFFYPRCLLSF